MIPLGEVQKFINTIPQEKKKTETQNFMNRTYFKILDIKSQNSANANNKLI